MKQVFKSPAFVVLFALGLFNTCASLLVRRRAVRHADPAGHPRGDPDPERHASASSRSIIAIYYAGELVWRERDRKMHEIIDATPLPNWAFVVPKTLAVALVLLVDPADQRRRRRCSSSCSRAITDFELGKYLLWYVLPQGVDWC